jgi:hypothetical protein
MNKFTEILKVKFFYCQGLNTVMLSCIRKLH